MRTIGEPRIRTEREWAIVLGDDEIPTDIPERLVWLRNEYERLLVEADAAYNKKGGNTHVEEVAS
jgi:hypothetical protein